MADENSESTIERLYRDVYSRNIRQVLEAQERMVNPPYVVTPQENRRITATEAINSFTNFRPRPLTIETLREARDLLNSNGVDEYWQNIHKTYLDMVDGQIISAMLRKCKCARCKRKEA